MTNLILVVFTLFATWYWGDWKNWKRYHATMLYAALCNLLYVIIYYNHYLWYINPGICGRIISEMCITLIIFPLTALLFLSNYPQNIKGQVVHIVKYIGIYYTVEWVYFLLGKITYSFGWTIWYSFIWLCGMYIMIFMHYKKPLAAYTISFLIIAMMLILFPVNLF